MRKFIHYFDTDFEERGQQHTAGEIFAVTDFSNGLNGCVEIELTEKQLHNIFEYLYLDGSLVYDKKRAEVQSLENLRAKRYELLQAFDIYRTNVQYGILKETQEQKENLLNWYQKILDLDEEAINNPPREITYYV